MLVVRFVDLVLRAVDIGDALQALPWERSTLEDLADLLAVRSAACCLLRDLSLGKPAHPALVAKLLGDDEVGDYLRERKLLV